MGFHARSRILPTRYYENHEKTIKTMVPLSSTTTLYRTAVGNIESRRIDASIPAVASSDIQIRTRSRGQTDRGAAAGLDAEMRPEGGVDGPRWTSGAAGT